MTQSRTLARLLTAIGAAIAALALLAPAASALTEPAEGFKQFAGCPDQEESSAVTICFRAEITGGHFQMGNKDTPVENPIVLSGGYNTKGTIFATSPKGGLQPAPQKVPGGVVGLTGLTWLLEFFGSDALTLYATTELAGTPGAPLANPFKLPIKVHLTTPSGALGNNCYIGSDAAPINLSLTTGTTNPPPPNEPISGTPFKFSSGGGITKASDAVYVDNSFAAPGANGCRLLGSPLVPIDSLVNTQAGLPSPAGTNETTQDTDAETAPRFLVYP